MLRDLGLQEFDFLEADSPFPAAQRPIYWLRCGVAMKWSNTKLEREFHVRRLDDVIGKRLDRKGIIHAVSYDRARYIKETSRYGDYMIIHDSDTTRATIEQFKQAAAPAILVSPSVHTGTDFPYDSARWQIIAKLPFPDVRSGIAAARQVRDRTYSTRFAATTIVQMVGRIVRSTDDAGETFIIDDTWEWFYTRNLRLFPKAFKEAHRQVTVAPEPMDVSSRHGAK
jgi:Rad3-related DNA helicase